MFLNASGSWGELTAKGGDTREHAVWEAGSKEHRGQTQTGTERSKRGGRWGQDFPFDDQEPLGELSCLNTFKQYT